MSKNNKVYLITEKYKARKLLEEKKLLWHQIIEEDNFENCITNLNGKKIIIDNKTLSVYKENIIKSKFVIIDRYDPCYYYKSIKNSKEIENMAQSHIKDGIALTKFIYWIKNSKNNKITELEAEKIRKI